MLVTTRRTTIPYPRQYLLIPKSEGIQIRLRHTTANVHPLLPTIFALSARNTAISRHHSTNAKTICAMWNASLKAGICSASSSKSSHIFFFGGALCPALGSIGFVWCRLVLMLLCACARPPACQKIKVSGQSFSKRNSEGSLLCLC